MFSNKGEKRENSKTQSERRKFARKEQKECGKSAKGRGKHSIYRRKGKRGGHVFVKKEKREEGPIRRSTAGKRRPYYHPKRSKIRMTKEGK